TRQVEAKTFQRKSGVTVSSTRRRATATGPGRMNSARWRADSHHASSASTTTPSPITRAATAERKEACSGRIVARHARLQRAQQIAVHAVHERDDEDDGGEDRGR